MTSPSSKHRPQPASSAWAVMTPKHSVVLATATPRTPAFGRDTEHPARTPAGRPRRRERRHQATTPPADRGERCVQRHWTCDRPDTSWQWPPFHSAQTTAAPHAATARAGQCGGRSPPGSPSHVDRAGRAPLRVLSPGPARGSSVPQTEVLTRVLWWAHCAYPSAAHGETRWSQCRATAKDGTLGGCVVVFTLGHTMRKRICSLPATRGAGAMWRSPCKDRCGLGGRASVEETGTDRCGPQASAALGKRSLRHQRRARRKPHPRRHFEATPDPQTRNAPWSSCPTK